MDSPNASAATALLALIDGGAAHEESEIRPHYEALDAISAEEIIGTWKGGRFDGGTAPDPINWYGKRFVSEQYVEPLLVHGENDTVRVFDKMGAASLREIKYQGVVSASLIYDQHPIMDYFRKVNDDLIVGWGEVKGSPKDSFFFYLQRTDAAVTSD